MIQFMTPLAIGTLLLIGACALAFAVPFFAKIKRLGAIES